MKTATARAALSEEDEKTVILTSRAIELLHTYLDEAFENEEMLDEIPNGCTLILLPHDDVELRDANMTAGLAAIERGENVYFRHVGETAVVKNDPATGC